MTTQNEFLQTQAPDGVMTPAQAAQFLELHEGDTGQPDAGSAPDAAPDAEQNPSEPQGTENETGNNAPPQQEPDPAKATVLARDGVHTIPYEKLVEAREGEKHWKAQAEAQAQELEALRAAAQARADAGVAPTQADTNAAQAAAAIDAGVDADLFGDFSEKAIAEGIQKLVSQQVSQIRSEMAQVVAPLQKSQAESATDAHYRAVLTRHPDAQSIAESAELSAWINRQPSFARAGYEAVLTKGSTAEVIEFLDTFKAATAPAQTTETSAGDAKAAAKTLIAKVQQPAPASLSDIPGQPGPGSRFEAMRQMEGPQLLDTMQNLTPKQIEDFLNQSL